MDEDIRELIDLLCTRAGMIMEDVSPEALTVGNLAGSELSITLELLERKVADLAALIKAAKVLLA